MADYPRTATIFHRYATVLVGNALVTFHNTNHDFLHYAHQTPPANGDSFIHRFYLAGGAHTLNVVGRTQNSAGRLDWYIDGVKVVSLQDWHSVGTVYNVVKTAIVPVVGNGRHTLTAVVNGKNVASINYYIQLYSIAFQ
jgi:hypothetical protein